MMDLKTYGYTEIEAIPYGLLLGRVTELRRELFTVMTERGEVTAVLKGSSMRTSMSRIKRATSLTRVRETKRWPSGTSKRRKMEVGKNEY